MHQPVVALFAGWAAALYPPHIYMATHVQAATWAALGVVGLLALACNPTVRVTWRRAAAAGAIGGWLLLVDPITALVLPVALLRLLLTARSQSKQPCNPLPTADRRLATFAAFTAAALVVIAPWLVRNYHVHGEFVFIKSSFGYALWQGNHPVGHGTHKVPKATVAAITADRYG